MFRCWAVHLIFASKHSSPAWLLAGLLPPLLAQGHPVYAGKTPRYVSLGSDRVNVRTGPGVRYPVAWRFVRRGLPVEIIAEYELWRKIRDRDGAEGWVHKSLLSGRRTVVVQGETRTFYKQPGRTMEPAFIRPTT